MLPALANDVLRLALDPDVSAAKLTAVVQKDPTLATRVIRLANSASSAPAGDITSINEAIIRVGTRAVRTVVMAVCYTSRVQDRGIYGAAGRAHIDHAIGAAYLAWSLGELTDCSPDEAFVCGLLHDIGKLLLLKLAHDFRAQTGVNPPSDELEAVMEEQHAACGALLLRSWKLPDRLVEAVAAHHDAAGNPDRDVATAITYAADRFAHRYGFGCDAEPWDPLEDPVATALGVDAAWVERADAYVPGLFDVARKIVG